VRIIVSGMVAGAPHQGGATWAVLQYVLGLGRLGHDVHLVEPVSRDKLCPATTRYFKKVMARFDLGGRSALLVSGTRETVGISYEELVRTCRSAEILVNVAGMLTDEALVGVVPCRVYLDLDPAFTQLWQAEQAIDMRLDDHTHFVTVGLALGTASSPVPTLQRDWAATLPPVVMEHWPPADRIRRNALTTVANWRSYGSIESGGVSYGQKAHSLRPLIDLPRRVDVAFLLALAIHPDEADDLAALAANGWQLIDPATVTGSPIAYQRFVQSSRAELGLAKSGYVVSRCGWFSDRSACYLASGRPVIAQETGFSDFLPTGKGLFAFRSVDDVSGAVEELKADYPGHARAARDIAEEYLDSDRVLGLLLERVGRR